MGMELRITAVRMDMRLDLGQRTYQPAPVVITAAVMGVQHKISQAAAQNAGVIITVGRVDMQA